MKHATYTTLVWLMLFPLQIFWGCHQKRANAHANHTSAHAAHTPIADTYTCPMHPEIIRKAPGSCPICGMTLIKKQSSGIALIDVSLKTILLPTNEFVIATIPVTILEQKEVPLEIEAPGTVAYDMRQTGTIASKTAGRIERLYVRYRFQKVTKGQRIMDIYSPELMTAQQNLLFILKNDPTNTSLLDAARQRLLLLGMTSAQVQQIIRTGAPMLSVAVYSNYSGHIHETASPEFMSEGETTAGTNMAIAPAATTQELSLKEGMYVQKGQSVFTVYNPSRLWALLSIYGENASLVKAGNLVRITPESAPAHDFRAKIDYIEPFYRPNSKTLTARVYFSNNGLHIPVGSQVQATIFANAVTAQWLPKEAVLSLGTERVVFRKEAGGFRAHQVETGLQQDNLIQITAGLPKADSVATNAQYLVDNEAFIKLKTP